MHPPTYGFTPAIVVHVAAATLALALGAALMAWRRKGTGAHRVLGRAWVALMAITAIGSFWIRTDGGFSWIHLLSIGTLAGLASAVVAARRRNVRAHRRAIISLYAGGLIVAGLFTLLPSRLLGWHLWTALGLA